MSDLNFFIESDRLYLSYFQPDLDSHCEFLVRLYNTPEFIASIGGKPTSITAVEAARELLEGRFVDEHERNGFGTYLVSLKPTTYTTANNSFPDLLEACVHVGTVSLMRGQPPNCYSVPDLGFAVLPEYTKRGIATEASRALLQYVETEKGVKDVLGLFSPDYEASKAVFLRLGFVDRGLHRLKVFGNVLGAVFTKPGMSDDLKIYGL
ncbi:uncharacterized protein E0L32_011210 [Thyridium curvatum]|uniref:N-acetyltransferase domain-containing protein n=1 Tax=Thyridium curvatum TaxID=1093900 RepID=A0A507BGN4_9PEZI|nr:uncharacterized protein E0L32_011210 [Thyridium curvatum]TPX19137.1 hypothetical protein E0L32_011210 [Thyridium curvatum]